MKIELDGHDEVRVGTPPDEVVDALADPRELLDMLTGMIRPSSTEQRWVMAEVQAGPVAVTPAVDVDVRRDDDHRVSIVGRPVPGHTPAHLDITLVVRPDPRDDDGSVVASRWEVAVEMPGPQLLASSVRPLMATSSRSATRQLAERLHRRFARPRS
jgi:carbon monoxide dehydrogenase subunit G